MLGTHGIVNLRHLLRMQPYQLKPSENVLGTPRLLGKVRKWIPFSDTSFSGSVALQVACSSSGADWEPDRLLFILDDGYL